MSACPKCCVNHRPYSCQQYAQLARAENAADLRRAQTRAGRRPGLLARLLRKRGRR